MMEEVEEDARVLRKTIPRRINTEDHAPDVVADLILEWIDQVDGQT